jgi:hypothetical protein
VKKAILAGWLADRAFGALALSDVLHAGDIAALGEIL